MGVSHNWGYLFGSPNNKDYSISGSILGSPYFGKLPYGRFSTYPFQGILRFQKPTLTCMTGHQPVASISRTGAETRNPKHQPSAQALSSMCYLERFKGSGCRDCGLGYLASNFFKATRRLLSKPPSPVQEEAEEAEGAEAATPQKRRGMFFRSEVSDSLMKIMTPI